MAAKFGTGSEAYAPLALAIIGVIVTARGGTGVPLYLTSAWSLRPVWRPSIVTVTSPSSLICGK